MDHELSNTPWGAIAAVLVVVFGAGGFLSEWLRNRRAALKGEERGQTRFQTRLLRRVEKLELDHDKCLADHANERVEHAALKATHEGTVRASQQLARQVAQLEADYATLVTRNRELEQAARRKDDKK